MKRKYSFCVNTESDERKVRKAIDGLRRMAAYGRMAQRALDSIRHNGEYASHVPLVTTPLTDYQNGEVEWANFPRFVEVSRDDIPNYGPLKIQFGQPVSGYHGGVDTEEIRVHISCMGWDPTNEWIPRTIHVGNARFKKNGGIMFVSQDDGEAGEVHKLYRSPSTDNSIYAYDRIGWALARNIIRFSGYDLMEGRVSQPIQDLRSHLGKWLMEDGHVQTFCRTVRDNALPAIVMNS